MAGFNCWNYSVKSGTRESSILLKKKHSRSRPNSLCKTQEPAISGTNHWPILDKMGSQGETWCQLSLAIIWRRLELTCNWLPMDSGLVTVWFNVAYRATLGGSAHVSVVFRVIEMHSSPHLQCCLTIVHTWQVTWHGCYCGVKGQS
jgi:hypothetical protein